MSDKRPIDTLREKDASELSLTDYLIGHDNGVPAGYRTQLGEIAARIIGPDAAGISPFYEEGTFTPTVIGGTTQPTVSYNNQNGWYIKLGKMVWFYLYIATNSISGGTGTLRFGGLPYEVAANQNSPVSIRPGNVDFGSPGTPYGFTRAGTTQLGIGLLRDGLSPNFPPISAWKNTSDIGMGGTYMTT